MFTICYTGAMWGMELRGRDSSNMKPQRAARHCWGFYLWNHSLHSRLTVKLSQKLQNRVPTLGVHAHLGDDWSPPRNKTIGDQWGGVQHTRKKDEMNELPPLNVHTTKITQCSMTPSLL